MIYKFFDKKSSGSCGATKFMPNYQLEYDLHKHIIRKFKTKKNCSSFRHNI